MDIVADGFPRIDLTSEDEARTLAPCLDRLTAVVMCAGIKRQFGDSLEAFEQNLAMAINLGKLLSDHPVGRVVFLSSSAVYGEEVDDLNLSESTPAQPTSYYGLAKFTSKKQLLRKVTAANPGSTLALLRPPLVYGCRDGGTIYGPSGFVRAALDGKPIVLWGDGSEIAATLSWLMISRRSSIG